MFLYRDPEKTATEAPKTGEVAETGAAAEGGEEGKEQEEEGDDEGGYGEGFN